MEYLCIKNKYSTYVFVYLTFSSLDNLLKLMNIIEEGEKNCIKNEMIHV